VKLEELVPPALRVLERSLESEDERVALAAARDTLDRAWGRATLAIRTEGDVQAPWEHWTMEQRAYVLAQLERRRALSAENGNGSDDAT
jgi:hypothetical protein